MKAPQADGSGVTNTKSDTSSQPLKTLYEKILEAKDDVLTEAFVNAICDGHELCSHNFSAGLLDYQKRYFNEAQSSDLNIIRDNIRSQCTNSDTQTFRALLAARKPMNRGLINSIREHLNLDVERTLFVEGTICRGKVSFRTISPWNGETVETSPKSKTGDTFSYNPNTCFRLTPDQFVEFKQGGKRTGNYTIECSVFVELVKKNGLGINTANAEKLWKELKNAGIIDAHNRLSSNWRNLIGKFNLKLEYCTPEFFSTLNNILSALSDTGSRSDRTWTEWNDQERSFSSNSACKILGWDVGILAELEHFAQKDDKFTYAHLPDADTLEMNKYADKQTITETPKQWMALAVPTKQMEETGSKPSSVKELLSIATNPKEVGAVRKLFRNSVKEYPPAAGLSSIGKTPCLFWKNAAKERKDTDLQMTASLNSLSSKPRV